MVWNRLLCKKGLSCKITYLRWVLTTFVDFIFHRIIEPLRVEDFDRKGKVRSSVPGTRVKVVWSQTERGLSSFFQMDFIMKFLFCHQKLYSYSFCNISVLKLGGATWDLSLDPSADFRVPWRRFYGRPGELRRYVTYHLCIMAFSCSEIQPPDPFGIGSETRRKNSVGEECALKFLGSRDGFHRVYWIDDSSSEYAPLIGSHGPFFRFWLANINYILEPDRF